ncbi:MAG: PEP-CTERM sorting domain-containing protein [Mariniblastus sp.]|nr:PEP-CTERM sorting domain-containing protein [Mariniblastus sp.]
MRRTLLCALTCLFLSFEAFSTLEADIILTGIGTAEIEDFTGFTASGFAPGGGSGKLDSNTFATSGWSNGSVEFGGSNDSGDFARGSSSGNESSGGIYAFNHDGAGDVGVGFQPGGSDFTPGDLTVRIGNSTGQSLSSFEIDFDIGALNNTERANSLNFSWSTDGTNFTDVGTLDFVSAEASDSNGWNLVDRNSTISFSNSLDNGNQFFLRWTGNDVSGSGSRDEFVLDNISVTGFAAAVPEPSSFIFSGLGLATVVLRRRRR